ncbi:hypothetical protein CEUSTIGMA_g28.t1 [Chlamydomonas eustigma]|uniref:C3H1-type domain-containing protein n=1 Tax=Chlamydomonas eustigma TaxID=1157962 RepID=A0A250WPJ0_9CHLO|nr:hypothetical protein CEUSTIGMA_g28.t1 [Chlamydomonas eustigma]|eukprot:GAX72572.1 hypothetical protein CEUSTIGMA_g28.t1 [Chlamydomonas eustigma]
MTVSGEVFGHFAQRGNDKWEPMMSESSEIFQAIVKNEDEKVASLLLQRPELLDTLLTFLYWGSDVKSNQTESKTSVTVKHRTPLMLAASSGSLSVVSFLLNQGADVTIKSSEDGMNALQAAESSGSTTIVSIVREAVAKKTSVEQSPVRGVSDDVMTQGASSLVGDSTHPAILPAHHQGLEMYQGTGIAAYGQSELTLPEYSTDEFRVFQFKVARCCKRFAHDWRTCPFAHPTENARRRDPREFQYCALACPDYKQGFCVRGDACSFAHGVFEAWLHPARYRTQLCKDGSSCHRPVCFFAHRLDELRTPTHTWMPSQEELLAAGVVMPPPGSVEALVGVPFPGAAAAAVAPLPSAATMLLTSGGLSVPPPPPPPLHVPSRVEPLYQTQTGELLSIPAIQQEQQLLVDPSSGLLIKKHNEDASSPAAAAAVMAFDELLSNATGFLENIATGQDVIGRPNVSSAVSVRLIGSMSPTGTGSEASSVKGVSTPDGQVTEDARDTAHNGLLANAMGLNNGGGGRYSEINVSSSIPLTALSPSGRYSEINVSSAASIQQQFQQQQRKSLSTGASALSFNETSPVGGADAASAAGGGAQGTTGLLGFTAPRMSNAFARRHGLNPRDNAMINLQKLALQSQMTPQQQKPMRQGYSGGYPSRGGGHAAHQFSQPQPQHYHQFSQHPRQQTAYLVGMPNSGGGGGSMPVGWSQAAPPQGGQLTYAAPGGVQGPVEYMMYNTAPGTQMYGGGTTGMGDYRGAHMVDASSISALNQSLVSLNLTPQQMQQSGLGHAHNMINGVTLMPQYGMGGVTVSAGSETSGFRGYAQG